MQLARAGINEAERSPVLAQTVTAKPVTVKGTPPKSGSSELESRSLTEPSPDTVAKSGNSPAIKETPSDRRATSGTNDSKQTNSGNSTAGDREATQSPFEDDAGDVIQTANNQATAEDGSVKEDRESQAASRVRHSHPVERGESPFSDANEVK